MGADREDFAAAFFIGKRGTLAGATFSGMFWLHRTTVVGTTILYSRTNQNGF